MSRPSLAGRRILVTRAEEDAAAWAERLTRRGAHPVLLPCLSVQPIRDAMTATRLQAALNNADWLVVSSRRGVECTAQLLGCAPPPHVRVAAVGPATAHAATEVWGRADLVASIPTSAALAAELAAVAHAATPESSLHAVIAGAAEGRRDAELVLASLGWRVTPIAVYRTVAAPAIEKRMDLREGSIDDVLLASPTAVQGLLNRAVLPCTARIITIGPTTSAAARAAGLTVAAEARRPGLDGMLEVMQ
ncbi:MAG: uroporphyrinogen-III synthase [Gemmatimonadetes bacterium]|nr:uroporphyrinogen-III synthase [Gemmatimonadota bacterium]